MTGVTHPTPTVADATDAHRGFDPLFYPGSITDVGPTETDTEQSNPVRGDLGLLLHERDRILDIFDLPHRDDLATGFSATRTQEAVVKRQDDIPGLSHAPGNIGQQDFFHRGKAVAYDNAGSWPVGRAVLR